METKLFTIYRDTSRRFCEVRWNWSDREPAQRTRDEQRLFLQLGPSLVAVNIWLTILGADAGYAFGTIYEYAKALSYMLTWLAQKPVQLGTGHRIEPSLFTLSRADMRALFAWFDIPASEAFARQSLCKTGQLPIGYHEYMLKASTRNGRLAALSTFYDWLIAEYLPENSPLEPALTHPLERPERPLTSHQVQARPDGLLPQSMTQVRRPSKLLRRRLDTPLPQALSPEEVQLIFTTIPLISFGHNAANRNGALVRLLLWGMLRVSELTSASWEAINGQTLVIRGKGRKYRWVPIADEGTWTYLTTYTNELRLPLEERFHGALLRQLDHETRPLTKHSVEHVLLSLKGHFQATASMVEPVQQRLMHSLCDKLHSHIFRATGATLMAAAGIDLVRLSLIMGHASPETTQRYYLAAEQMNLPLEVKRICLRVQETLEMRSGGRTPAHSPFGWYERKGYLLAGKGDQNGYSFPSN